MKNIMAFGSYTAIFAIGSYTSAPRHEIARVKVDAREGAITAMAPIRGVGSPIYFARNRAGDRLYVAQTPEPNSDRLSHGAVAAYSVNGEFDARPVGLVEFPFSVPCHISLTHDGSKLLFAEYSAAHAGAVAINADGGFGEVAIVHHEGSGPNKKRQASAHCHCAVASPDDRFMFVCDLGTDTVNAYGLDTFPALSPRHDLDFHAEPGLGPRHLVFDASGKRAYIVYELGSAVQALSYDAGRLAPLQPPLSMLPGDFAGETKAAAIRISPCGRWLLASNRGHDSIAAFRINGDGTLCASPVISPLTGHFPRDFAFVNGECLIVGHKLSDNVGLYRFDPATGAITRMDATYEMPRPLAFVQAAND